MRFYCIARPLDRWARGKRWRERERACRTDLVCCQLTRYLLGPIFCFCSCAPTATALLNCKAVYFTLNCLRHEWNGTFHGLTMWLFTSNTIPIFVLSAQDISPSTSSQLVPSVGSSLKYVVLLPLVILLFHLTTLSTAHNMYQRIVYWFGS
jgi:hypothetical protein